MSQREGCYIPVICPPCKCPAPEFAEIYSNAEQLLAPSFAPNTPGQVALFEQTIYASPGIDISNAASLGTVTVNVAGWYDVATGICGALNPLPSPLPVWTLSLFKNGLIVPGSTFANMTLSPEQQANEIVADVYLHCAAGDVISLHSTSTSAVQLKSPSLGTNAQPSSAYLKIFMLSRD